MSGQAQALVELSNISKSFGAMQAIKGVNLKLHAGQITGLLGDNGAGKSTLIKILSGYHEPTSGEIRISGSRVRMRSPREARAQGIETVYQDLGLIDDLSIARNFFLGCEPGRFGFLNRRKMNAVAYEALSETGIRVRNPEATVRHLSGGERQAIAIARAWYFGRQILILDEPTSALSIQETNKVFHYMRLAKQKGMSVVFITHNMLHAQQICDRLFVLHHGAPVGDFPPSISREELEQWITNGEA